METSASPHLTLGQLITILASTSLAPAVASTVLLAPKIRSVLDKRKRAGPIHLKELYEDEDGVATELTESEYTVHIQKVVAIIAAIAGTACSYSSSVRSLVNEDYSFIIGWWVYTAAWVGISRTFFKLYSRLLRANMSSIAMSE